MSDGERLVLSAPGSPIDGVRMLVPSGSAAVEKPGAEACCGTTLLGCDFTGERFMRYAMTAGVGSFFRTRELAVNAAGCERRFETDASGSTLFLYSPAHLRAFSGLARWQKVNGVTSSITLADYLGRPQTFNATWRAGFGIAALRRVPDGPNVRVELCAIMDVAIAPFLTTAPSGGSGECVYAMRKSVGPPCVQESPLCVSGGPGYPDPTCSTNNVCPANQITHSYSGVESYNYNRPGAYFSIPPGQTQWDSDAEHVIWDLGSAKLLASWTVPAGNATNAVFDAMTASLGGFQTWRNQNAGVPTVVNWTWQLPSVSWSGADTNCLLRTLTAYGASGAEAGSSDLYGEFYTPIGTPVYDASVINQYACEPPVQSGGNVFQRRPGMKLG